jgi:putative ABC transport system substrate-binding protein
MMQRREFVTLIGGAAITCPFDAWAQQPAIPVVGILLSGSLAMDSFRVAAIERGLNAMGFIVGQNVAFEYRWAENQYDRLPRLAAELVGRRVAVLVATGNAATLAAKKVTTAIPVVFEVGTDPVALGLVASLARPEGNLTGVTFLGASLVAKQFELLHETVPKAAAIGFLENPRNPTADSVRREVQAVALARGQTLIVASFHRQRFRAGLRTVGATGGRGTAHPLRGPLHGSRGATCRAGGSSRATGDPSFA